MTARRFPHMKANRIKDLFGVVLLVLTALLYFEDAARAQTLAPGDAESVTITVDR